MNRVIAPPTRSKTVVVLLGWLGSHPKSLRRYESLYRNLLDGCSSGDDVPSTVSATKIIQTYIAPPFTIVQSVLESPIDDPIRVPFEWPLQHSYCYNIRSIQDLAWNVLQDIHDNIHQGHGKNHIYIHAFSNGGCFVWEKIRQILLFSVESAVERHETHVKSITGEPTDPIALVPSTIFSDVQSRILLQIRQQLRGVVFDSCPISDLHRLPEALHHCTITERIQVLRYCHYKYLSMQIDPNVKEQVQKRIERYITGLQNDPLHIKQLYIYSRDDPLAPSSFIDEMVQYRRRQLHGMKDTSIRHVDEEMVTSCVWEKSQHCGHYIHHPKEYTTAIETFLGNRTKGNDNNINHDKNLKALRSKL